MSYGLEVYSANGSLQVTTETIGNVTQTLYQVNTTGSVSISNATTGNFGYMSTGIAPAGMTDDSIIVFRPQTVSSQKLTVQRLSVSGNPGFKLWASANGTYNYVVYNLANTTAVGAPSSSDYGLIVYDDSGNQNVVNQIFTGDTKALRIKTILVDNASFSSSSTSLYGYCPLNAHSVKTSAVTSGFYKASCIHFTSGGVSQIVDETIITIAPINLFGLNAEFEYPYVEGKAIIVEVS